ncbi:kanamycin kinase [Paraoerskovia marina]|uniref:Kanamycin kinase n=1 Tax=Paraoerskovia marina TaxID=545619 RepID=A0A1H1RG07_9CELL|nr:aminoglycoside 3'-phosphotransferase [Paraoerskovia marina]SDS34476.1 kanamycin kinase [Paraoerskovia marina]
MTVIAGPPSGRVALPPHVTSLLTLLGVATDDVVPVWQGTTGVLTFRAGAHHVKWAPASSGIDVTVEADRISWAAPHVAVPEVVGQASSPEGSWMVTRTLPGSSAVAERWLADPEAAARAVGRGLRTFHDSLPVEACPTEWSIAARVANARTRVDRGDSRALWAPEHRGYSIGEALSLLASPPPLDLVVCHGDACLPNTLLHDDGALAGHVDLGTLGVADRWADLAVAAWSTGWNYGEGYEDALYAGYGLAPDPAKISYYRLLWDLS